MDTDRDDAVCLGINTRRDSGFNVDFDCFENCRSLQRDSGLDITDLDRFRNSRSNSENDDLDLYLLSKQRSGNKNDFIDNSATSISSIDETSLVGRDFGSPIYITGVVKYSSTCCGTEKKKEPKMAQDIQSNGNSPIRKPRRCLPKTEKKWSDQKILISDSLEGNRERDISSETCTIGNDDETSEKQLHYELSTLDKNTENDQNGTPKERLRRRSRGKDKNDEQRHSLTGKPPRPSSGYSSGMSKVSVSSRVDIMLKSDVFKKYLLKHENLIEKISMRQGRGMGMKKALSNLDLSQLDFSDSQTQDKRTNLNISASFNDEKLKASWEKSPSARSRRNTICQFDYRSSVIFDKEKNDSEDNEKRNYTHYPLPDSSTIRQRGGNRQKFSIPSFLEFKMSKHFKEIPEEDPFEVESEISCENCDKNRTFENDRRKSRSHSRVQRIKEKYLQNHEDLSVSVDTSSNLGETVDRNQTKELSPLKISPDSIKVNDSQSKENSDFIPKTDVGKYELSPKEIQNSKRSGIPVRMKSCSPILSPRQQQNKQLSPRENDNLNSSSKIPDEDCSKLPPRSSFDGTKQRTILRASRKRKLPQKKPFSRSRSDSQLKIDSANEKKQLDKNKPAPLEIKTVHSCENFNTMSSPLFSASTYDYSNSPRSATVGSFDFSQDHIVKFELEKQDVRLRGDNLSICSEKQNSTEENLIDLSDLNDTNSKSKAADLFLSREDNSDPLSTRSNNCDTFSMANKTRSDITPLSGADDCITVSGTNNANDISIPRTDNPLSGKDNSDLTHLSGFDTGINDDGIPLPRKNNSDLLGQNSAISNVELWSDNSDRHKGSSTHSSSCDDIKQEPSSGNQVPSQTSCIYSTMDTFLSQQSLPSNDELSAQDIKNFVTRSTSDVCNSTTSDALRKRRERKERPYKSDPFTGSTYLQSGKERIPSLSENDVFETDEISLEEVEEEESSVLSDQDWEKERKKQHRLSDISTDSGVTAPECPPSPTSTVFSTSSSILCTDNDSCFGGMSTGRSLLYSESFDNGPRSPHQFKVSGGCKDCGNFENNNRTKICSKCEKKSVERKEIILEIKDTEESYGRDLAILKEHFYKPMKSHGLLSLENLEGIFLNLEELVHVNTQFVKKLQSAVDLADNKGDENLKTVSIGNLFLDSTTLILAFENYCVNQGQAAVLLEQLERDKELLRIFLQVSQDENPILRRMPLKSFLMVPVQRIMRYPLLLERLYKFTSGEHSDKSAIMEAKLKIEDILDHINSKTKHGGTIKIKRKISDNSNQNLRISITEKIEVNKVAIEVLGWNRKEVCDIVMCRLLVAALSDQTWAAKRLKSMKFTTVHCVLLTLGQGDSDMNEVEEDGLLFSHKTKVIQAAVVLIKEKNGKYQTFREPFMLNRCIVSEDPEVENAFELSDLTREPYVFKGDDLKDLKTFLQNVKQQTLNLGTWRRRRNALPNIMIKHVV